jgi:hypothetical protein
MNRKMPLARSARCAGIGGTAAATLILVLALALPWDASSRVATAATPAPSTAKVVAFHETMDRLWQDQANPVSWPLAATTKMINNHLKLTTNEAVARLQGNWKADIAAYDKVRAEILMMSDTLAKGIVRQFRGRFD